MAEGIKTVLVTYFSEKAFKEGREVQKAIDIGKVYDWIINHNGNELVAESLIKYIMEE